MLTEIIRVFLVFSFLKFHLKRLRCVSDSWYSHIVHDLYDGKRADSYIIDEHNIFKLDWKNVENHAVFIFL
jgi:hypothetical protein